jgi:uncharacterized Zn-finger protein
MFHPTRCRSGTRVRDQNMTGYAPRPIAGVTPTQIVAVRERSVPCDGAIVAAGLGHPRIWLRIEGTRVTCPYCSITYALEDGAGDDHGH